MVRFLFLIGALMIVGSVCAQTTLTNLDFESWQLSSSGRFEDPNPSNVWATPNYAMDLIFGNISNSLVQKSTDAHGGSFSALLKSRNIVTSFAGATLFTGWLDKSNPFSPKAHLGVPFTGRPISVTGWRKYTSVGGDSSSIYVKLTRWNSSTNSRETIAFKELRDYTSITSWTSFTLNLDYSSNMQPDSITLVFSASAGAENNDGEVGSTLLIDDVSINYPQSIHDVFTQANESLILYPNPCITNLFVEAKSNARYYKVTNFLGQVILEGNLASGENQITVHTLFTGVYTLSILDAVNQTKQTAVFTKL